MAGARIVPVIMAGGASSRLWPASDRQKPKWNLRLFGTRSLLEQAWQRARAVAPAADCYVVAGVAQAALARRSLRELPARNLLVEPLPRDTAGAIALAAGAISRRVAADISPRSTRRPQIRTQTTAPVSCSSCSSWFNPVMLVLPGDHIIQPLSRFKECVLAGARAAKEQDTLVTFGILPRRPATAYGYVQCGPEIRLAGAKRGAPRVYQALGFREKPDLRTARRYVASGHHYWNGGIFLWTLAALTAEFERQLPGHAAFIRALAACPRGGRGERALQATVRRAFPALRKISVDFGIMEHARRVATVAADFAWDDIGSWSAVAEHLDRTTGNAIGPGTDVIAVGARSNVVLAPGKRVALVGVEGLAVVDSDGCILVCRLDRDQDVKKASELAFRRRI
ncbi:MAG: sugar phosphate nucleotidyltransferase [Planctomycetota bacterium]|nr:sugar phosphate nucleotidyltransferase [Planctomycetota bacterium]